MSPSDITRVEKLKARRDVNGLIRMLKFQDNWDVCESAAKALGEWKEAQAVEPLITLLGHEYYRVRDAAVKSLREIGPSAAIALGAALKDPDVNVRTAAAGLLWEIGDVRVLQPLLAAMEDACREVRRAAAGALLRIGDARALVAFVAALEDVDAQVRGLAAKALDEMSWKADSLQAAITYWIAKQDWQRCVQAGHAALQPLMALLKDDDWQVREGAAWALGEIGAPQAVDALCHVLMHDETNYVREAAAQALGRLGEVHAIEPLTTALADRYSSVRSRAADSLDALGWKPGIDSLAAAYWIVRRNVPECARIGAPAIKPLIDELNEGAMEAAEMAAEALVQIGGLSVEPLMASLENVYSYARLRAAESLGRIGDPRAVDPLRKVLRDAFPEVSVAAAQSLARIGAAAVERLLSDLQSPELSVRRWAAEDLASVFRTSMLDPAEKHRILSHQSEIVSPHQDTSENCIHSDSAAVEL